MKQIDNLLECTKAMHVALEKHDMALLDESCEMTMQAIKEVEAIGGMSKIPPSDRIKLREITSLSEENYELAQKKCNEVAALLEAVRLNHR
jgi:hypothetical protein